MTARGDIWAGMLGAVLTALPAMAQIPQVPDDFPGHQFVDAQGCAYQRQGNDWQPRRGRDGAPLCGYPPTVIAADPPAKAPSEAPDTSMAKAPTPPAGPTLAQPTLAQPGLLPPQVQMPDPLPAAPQPPEAGHAQVMGHCALIGLGAQGRVAGDPSLGFGGIAPPLRACSAAPAADDFTAKGRANKPPRNRAAGTPRASTPQGAPRAGRHALPPPPPAQAGHRFVQVGSYADPANSARAIARIITLGLPAARGKGRIRGQSVEVIYAGPFDDSARLARALIRLRQAGYADAFAR
ncbi:SPOR domain-containing protein [Paracoccus sp. p4-l81]|uniref:SPOR domain-containing protein n=1 Tax=unclassified Paracoccus (in: a-proteobacteria) TaxID=2688777 RepID=UPI0035B7CD06